jgi:hypothetical protein
MELLLLLLFNVPTKQIISVNETIPIPSRQVRKSATECKLEMAYAQVRGFTNLKGK